MGMLVSLVGFSGAGKTRSIKGLLKEDGRLRDDAIVIKSLAKEFPFKHRMIPWDKDKKEGDYINLENGILIAKAMKKFIESGKKIIIVDDSTFVMTKYFMNTAKEKGFEKFTDLAKQYYEILVAGEKLPEDVRVYIVNHLEESNLGRLMFKTIGKLISEKVDIAAMMIIIMQAEFIDGSHKFITNKRNDIDVAKSPEEMFDLLVENDLGIVDNAICEYYGIGG